ncbi:aa3-type cytochrome c oxidase subunit IV [Fertoebacter nigrum]|uniref:Aa3-type cytochrome c oxidase subunit IV n=1 Tax=Fertoeibacter niger TaxID=2656921 RepID=A0A8X8GX66_9RHOB|nr:aa3-type cytochrome c oxidase subunit IV [Fertoeibacter niger]NUB44742.1 aa3-type cytochrome c oxidase subunit IV [Fertoeibacter niger]
MADHGKDHAEHVHGSMDTSVQEKTFAGFIRLSTWGAGISIGVLIFMALVNS